MGSEAGEVVPPFKKRTTSSTARRQGQGVDRRTFLKALAGGAVAATTARGALALKGDAERGSSALKKKVGGLLDGSDDEGKVMTGSVQEAVTRKPPIELDIYPDLLTNKDAARNPIRDAATEMFPKVQDNLEIISQQEEKIRQAAKEHQTPEDLLLGLVITESVGDRYAVSSAGAKGLTQMMDEMAKKHGLQVSGADTKAEGYNPKTDPDDRFNPDLILEPTTRELREAYDTRWGNWGLTFWEWHAGATNIYNALQVYISDKHQLQLPDIKVIPTDNSEQANAVATTEASRRVERYKSVIKEKGINVFEMLQYPAIINMFNELGYDYTKKYIPRIVASSLLYNSLKSLV